MDRRALALASLAMVAAVAVAGCWGSGGPSRSTWAFAMIEADDLAGQGLTCAGVTVAIIDTGIDLAHPNLQGVAVAFWEDLVRGQAQPYDDHGHGTAMASILVGRGSLAGGAPGVTLIVIKAIAADGSGSDQTVATAISDAASHGADIISLSLGGAASGLLRVLGSASVNAAQAAAAQGVLVVGSAGNDGESDDGQVAAPSVARDAISVGAVDSAGTLGAFSSVGRPVPLQGAPDQKPEVVAPGVRIAVAWVGGGTAEVSGTSPAAVFVSVGLALLLEMKPTYQRAGASGVDAVKSAVMSTARSTGGQAEPHDAHYGYGLLQARAAAQALP